MSIKIHQAEKCLFCDGYKYNCPNYSPIKKDVFENEVCLYSKIIDIDLEKLATHTGTLEFTALEELLKPKDLRDVYFSVKPCQR